MPAGVSVIRPPLRSNRGTPYSSSRALICCVSRLGKRKFFRSAAEIQVLRHDSEDFEPKILHRNVNSFRRVEPTLDPVDSLRLSASHSPDCRRMLRIRQCWPCALEWCGDKQQLFAIRTSSWTCAASPARLETGGAVEFLESEDNLFYWADSDPAGSYLQPLHW